jgi:hypothetical protein
MKENQMQMGGAGRLPLVGPGATKEFKLPKATTHYERKPTRIGGADCLPLVGPGIQNPNQKGDP